MKTENADIPRYVVTLLVSVLSAFIIGLLIGIILTYMVFKYL